MVRRVPGAAAYVAASLIRTETARVTHAASATQFSSFSRKTFSFPAPETNWTKLAVKTLVKHERLASPAPLLSTIPHGAVTWP